MSLPSTPLLSEIKAIRLFAISVIYSAVAVASSTFLIFIPNLETLSLIFFIVGYRYGYSTGFVTVLTSVTVYEFFASQFYGSGGLIPFLLKFPPYFLIVIVAVLFRKTKNQDLIKKGLFLSDDKADTILYQPQGEIHEVSFSFYEHVLISLLGVSLTIIYDIVTSIGILVFVPSFEGLFISFITGLPFVIFHQATNAFLFFTIPSILVALDKARQSDAIFND
ncbi:hypothetical protein [Candidatus Hodarchaeum mangrovi]